MASPRLRRLGAAVGLLGVVWLWLAAICATLSVATERAPACSEWPRVESSAISTSVAAETSVREDMGDRVESLDDFGEASALQEAESDPDGHVSQITRDARTQMHGCTRVRPHAHRFVGQCCARLSLTRAPPVADTTVA